LANGRETEGFQHPQAEKAKPSPFSVYASSGIGWRKIPDFSMDTGLEAGL
jgi:hypothetical protein